MFKRFTVLMTALVLAGIMATPISAHRSGGSSAVTTAGLSMRTCASTSCHRVRVIPSHKRVRVRGCRGSWCKVSYRGHTGFVSKRYLSRRGHHHHRRHHHRRHRGNGVQLKFQFSL